MGNTLDAGTRHPSLREIEVANLSVNVFFTARFFECWNHGVLADPRILVFVDDGR